MHARERQLVRDGIAAHQLGPTDIGKCCALNEQGTTLLETAATRLGLPARAYHRILKVARTIADLDTSDKIGHAHLGEAIAYRALDRKPPG